MNAERGGRSNNPLSKPPEGAVVGEDVPRENEQLEVEDSKIEEAMNALKTRGEPYMSMDESELREKAIEIIRAGE